ncbi:MAG: Primase 2 [Parachlamydiales bacterium]|nr:Primase 2 [Parachlamydiales bacterium]
MFIEAKGKDGYWIDNFKHLIISSNEDWAVHLDPDDRRFYVLDVSDSRKEDNAYFDAIVFQMENGGYEALLYNLLDEDLVGYDPRIMPENFSGFDMKLQSASTIDKYLHISLLRGCWDHPNVGPSSFMEEIKIDRFFDHYRDWCDRERLLIFPISQVGRRLRKIFPNILDSRPCGNEDGYRPRYYIFPPLAKCRKDFENFYKQDSRIWEQS